MRALAADREQFFEAILRCLEAGPSDSLKRGESERGYTPLSPGDVPWFPAADWHPKDTISLDGKRVRIVAIIARNEATGAFSRMITGIAKENLLPVVIEPMLFMPFILQGWGWHKRIAGTDFASREEQWFPTRKWIEARKAISP
jgi:hypothetical protein